MPYDSLDERKPDLSYLSKQPPVYDPSTVGMPLDMAATATRNLAIRDAGDAKVNAVRSNLVMPTGSLGSTARTETANISIARAMERADRGNRFGFGSQEYLQNTDTPVRAPQVDPVIGQLRSRQQQLLQGIDPDKPAIYPNSKRQAEMRQELYHVTGILHEQTLADAHDAHENYRQQRDIQSAEEFSGLVNGLAGMKTKPGTPEHAVELANLVQQYPLGAQSKAAMALLKTHTDTHVRHSTLRESIDEFTKATGMPPDSIETTATGGFNLRRKNKDAAEIPSHTLDRYAKLQGVIESHRIASEAEAKQNIADKKADTPYSKSAEWGAAQRELAILEKSHPALKISLPDAASTVAPNISQADYEKLKPGETYQWNGKTLTKK